MQQPQQEIKIVHGNLKGQGDDFDFTNKNGHEILIRTNKDPAPANLKALHKIMKIQAPKELGNIDKYVHYDKLYTLKKHENLGMFNPGGDHCWYKIPKRREDVWRKNAQENGRLAYFEIKKGAKLGDDYYPHDGIVGRDGDVYVLTNRPVRTGPRVCKIENG